MLYVVLVVGAWVAQHRYCGMKLLEVGLLDGFIFVGRVVVHQLYSARFVLETLIGTANDMVIGIAWDLQNFVVARADCLSYVYSIRETILQRWDEFTYKTVVW